MKKRGCQASFSKNFTPSLTCQLQISFLPLLLMAEFELKRDLLEKSQLIRHSCESSPPQAGRLA
jgi:hypothetical protein